MRQFTSPTSSVLYFLHSDHLGSTSLTTDNSGNALTRQLYDAWGNVRTILDNKAGPQTQTFIYDALDRLQTAQATGGLSGTYPLETYTYDPIGNIKTKPGVGVYTYTASTTGCVAGTPNIKPHAVSGAGTYAFGYDCNGNMLTRNDSTGTFTQQWDTENRLITVTGSATGTFVYDGDGNRVKATLGTTTTIYIGNYYEQSGSVTTTYYYAGSTRIAMRQGVTVTYLLGDHLGSTAIAANGTTGALLSEQRYKPWGEQRYPAGASTVPTRRQYTGQINDSEIGLYFYGARMYSPALGRFVSADTLVPDGKNPQQFNRYSYGLNNPVKYQDPSGHYVCDEDTGDCSTRRWHRFGAAADLTRGQLLIFFGIRLTADNGQSWSDADIRNISSAVQQMAAAMDFSTWRDGRPTVANIAGLFKRVMGSVAFNRSSDQGQDGAYAFTKNAGQLIEVYSNAPAGRFSFQNAAHELGHAFSQRLGRRPYTYLKSAEGEIGYVDKRGKPIHVAGGGGERTFLGMAGYPWIQDDATVAKPGVDPDHEDFADMFLNWTYGNFFADEAGAARQAWMTTNIAEWVR